MLAKVKTRRYNQTEFSFSRVQEDNLSNSNSKLWQQGGALAVVFVIIEHKDRVTTVTGLHAAFNVEMLSKVDGLFACSDTFFCCISSEMLQSIASPISGCVKRWQ
eukprot:5771414-Ditylum_brightwellii.AAC.1